VTATFHTLLPAITIDDISVAEGDSGTVNATFTVSLAYASSQTVTVQYKTTAGTASGGGDYTGKSLTTLTLAPGETSKPVTILVKGDSQDEDDESFYLDLSNPTNATLGRTRGICTILDDDPQVAAISVNDVSVFEGNPTGTTTANFNVTLSPASGRTVTVQYSTQNGTATQPADYISKSGTLTFSAGQTSKTVSVSVKRDSLNEPDETFFVNLSGATNATIGDAQGIGTILNDDP
jgi:hypothetical protein